MMRDVSLRVLHTGALPTPICRPRPQPLPLAPGVQDKLARGPGFPIELPCRHRGWERGLKRENELRKLVQGQAGHIEELARAGLQSRPP